MDLCKHGVESSQLLPGRPLTCRHTAQAERARSPPAERPRRRRDTGGEHSPSKGADAVRGRDLSQGQAAGGRAGGGQGLEIKTKMPTGRWSASAVPSAGLPAGERVIGLEKGSLGREAMARASPGTGSLPENRVFPRLFPGSPLPNILPAQL